MAGFGETLRQARAHKGVTLREAEQATRINRHHLAALEDENFSAMPPLIYQRGIVRNYAVYLELDASNMLTKFEEAHGGASPTSQLNGSSVPPIDMPSHWAPNFAIIAFAVVLSAIVFAWGYSIWVTPTGDDPGLAATVTNTPEADQVALATQLPDRPAPPTVAPTVEPEPTATTSDVAVQEVSGRQDAGDNQLAEAAGEAPVEESETAPVYRTGISLAAASDIEVTLVVDGELVYEGVLPAGQQTDQFVGSTFSLTTSSQVQTNFINSCGDTSTMGEADSPGTLEFAAHEGSCPVPGE